MYAWTKFLEHQEKILGKETAKKWLYSLKVLRFDACNIYLEADSAFQISWFNEHIREKAKRELKNNNGREVNVHIQLKTPLISKESKTTQATDQYMIKEDTTNPVKTFSSYFISEENTIATKLLCELTGYDLTQKTLEKPSLELATFNPIVLYGLAGSGKTHLLMAAAQAFKDNKKNVFFIHAKTFTKHVVQAIRNGRIQEFRKAYRHVDILILDDIHHLANKNATQEEFFHTFNALHSASCQMIFTSNVVPSQLLGIAPRLISRCEWGISIELKRLQKESLLDFIDFSAHFLDLNLSKEIQAFIASSFSYQSYYIQHALEALALRLHLNDEKKQLSVEICQNLLQDLIQQHAAHSLTYATLIEHAASYFGVKKEDILGKSQTKQFTFPRQISMFLCRKQLKLTLKRIGSIFSRDHSTVITSIKYIEKGIEIKDTEITTSLHRIMQILEK